MTKNTKQELINDLVTSGIISDELLPSENTTVLTSDELYKVLSSAYELGYDDDENVLYYINESGDKITAPDMSEGMSTASEWLCDVLPEPKFDIDQGGSVRRSVEIRSLYTLVCLAIVFSELSSEIRDFIDAYDFIEFQSICSSKFSFNSAAEMLKSYTDLNSLQINCVVSASAINLTQAQEKKDALWRANLTREETLELSKISREIKSIILEYEKDKGLNPIDVNELTKIQKLTAIQQRDIEIEEVINSSKYSTLYRITKFNSERLSPITKRKILNTAMRIAELQVELCKEVKKSVIHEVYDTTYYEVQRSLIKKAVSTLIDKEVKKYKSDVNNYVFKKKI